MFTPLAAGLLTGLSLIVAIGAQNAFVLRQGVARSWVGPVVAVCAISDLVLIAAGVGGMGVAIGAAGWLVSAARWLGAAFLAWYGVTSLRRVFQKQALDDAAVRQGPSVESLRPVLGRALALTWLNPHVYLDTVLLLGSVAATYPSAGGLSGRWAFAIGAGLASIGWFTGLGYGARLLAPLFTRPRSWQVLDVVVGATVLGVAATLVTG